MAAYEAPEVFSVKQEFCMCHLVCTLPGAYRSDSRKTCSFQHDLVSFPFSSKSLSNDWK